MTSIALITPKTMMNSNTNGRYIIQGYTMQTDWITKEKVMKFNKYLLFYGPGEQSSGLKGIRSDAPSEIIEVFLNWYRSNYRYKNGRMRSKEKIAREVVMEVGEYIL